ncbi:hypothetical protein [Allorhizocola rhizosphaerae]|uniref:hypothetical protein n=1 Tax=Allorhizocola rhizosphaerae TaxID=1872709 RepID=UPI000E3DF587|nr:hypothetical protein [Allorhizocola rhizosphaerae]
MKVSPIVLAFVTTIAAPAVIVSSPAAVAGPATLAPYPPTSPMVFVTANIGRDYTGGASKISSTLERIRGNVNNASNGRPRFIGWQEIDEDDPAEEMQILKDVYPSDTGWERSLNRTLPDGTTQPLKVPAVAHDAQKTEHRVAFGSSGLESASPTRWITITRFDNQNISFINTHFIAGAFGDCDNRCAERLDRWKAHWESLKDQVAREHNAGYNVVVTGDFNRRKVAGGWTPASVHPDAHQVKDGGVDHIIAIPRQGWQVDKIRYADGSFKQGEWWIGIDSHEAHWVTLQFQQR